MFEIAVSVLIVFGVGADIKHPRYAKRVAAEQRIATLPEEYALAVNIYSKLSYEAERAAAKFARNSYREREFDTLLNVIYNGNEEDAACVILGDPKRWGDWLQANDSRVSQMAFSEPPFWGMWFESPKRSLGDIIKADMEIGYVYLAETIVRAIRN